MTARYAVMGNPIAHSLSPKLHELFARQTGISLTYEKILVDLAHFEQQVGAFFYQGGKGLNITLPCKERAFAMSDHVSERARQAKAVNTLWMDQGLLCADNTDGIGFLRDIQRHTDLSGKRILILGAGGAARGIIGSLLTVNALQLSIVNRTALKLQLLLNDFPQLTTFPFADLADKSFDVIINATSAQGLRLPSALASNKPFCYDLTYNLNHPTPFLTWAQAERSTAKDGLGMLVEQGAEAFFIWHGVRPDTEAALRMLATP
jgi:shikimate dehydrogenase